MTASTGPFSDLATLIQGTSSASPSDTRTVREPDTILGKMRFPTPPARRSKLEIEHVNAIRAKARELGLGSIALATVLQFELSLRQKDVIGEWEPAPLSEGGIVHKGTRWVNGPQWSDIDSNFILRETQTKTGAYVEFDLKLYPAILEEIDCVAREKRIGPMIISENTGEPYKHRTFTQTWRKAGVPKSVWNMDARAGSISEAYECWRWRDRCHEARRPQEPADKRSL